MIGVGEQEHVISTIVTGGLRLPVYHDPQELKKRRNRLAQRKHREPPKKPFRTSFSALENAKVSAGLRANASTNSGQHDAPEETSAHRKTSSLPGTTLTQHQSEASKNQIPCTIYQSGEMTSAMDFPMPGSPESANDSGQLPDLEQHMIRISEAPFDNVGTTFLPENLGMQQDLVAQAYRGFLPQNDPSLVYEMRQQQPPQCQPQAARPSHTGAEVEVSRPLLQTPLFFPPNMSNANSTRKPYNSFVAPNSEPGSSGKIQDQTTSNSSCHMRSETDTESSSAPSGRPETPDSIPDTEDLEARFESVISAVEEAGFESIDDMSAQYYTATFKEDTVSHWAQSRSRSRSLHVFLATLHASTNNWSHREVQGYQRQIAEAAESLYVGELSYAREDIMQDGDGRSQDLGRKASSPVSQTATSVQSLWQTLAEMQLSQDFKQKKKMAREKVSFPNGYFGHIFLNYFNPKRHPSSKLIQGVVDAGNLVTSG